MGTSIVKDLDFNKPMIHPDDPRRFDQPEQTLDKDDVTAAVTGPDRTPAEDPIPDLPLEFVRNPDNSLKYPELWKCAIPQAQLADITMPASPPQSLIPANVASVDASAGASSGSGSEGKVTPGLTGAFDHFRVDPGEIESKIKSEADRRWRNWVMTKTEITRPRKSTFLKRVRKEYYK